MLSSGMMRSVVLVLALLVPTLSGCREEEAEVSGVPWECTCHLAPDETEVEALVCTIRAGEAALLAQQCVQAAMSSAVPYCECLESPQWVCELGACTIR